MEVILVDWLELLIVLVGFCSCVFYVYLSSLWESGRILVCLCVSAPSNSYGALAGLKS